MTNIETKKSNLNEWFALMGKSYENEKDKLMKQIEDLRNEGKTIYPAQENILESLSLVNPNDVKVVILGQDPYHEPNQAMGLAFSVPDGTPFPPSLKNIFKELQADLGCDVPNSGDLTRWAKQGVLLLNTVLTVEAHKANSHRKHGWEAITSKVIEIVIKQKRPVVFLCWGAQADRTLKWVLDATWGLPTQQRVLRSTHPSPLSATKSTNLYPAFIGSRPFSKANEWLESHGAEPINWALQ